MWNRKDNSFIVDFYLNNEIESGFSSEACLKEFSASGCFVEGFAGGFVLSRKEVDDGVDGIYLIGEVDEFEGDFAGHGDLRGILRGMGSFRRSCVSA